MMTRGGRACPKPPSAAWAAIPCEKPSTSSGSGTCAPCTELKGNRQRRCRWNRRPPPRWSRGSDTHMLELIDIRKRFGDRLALDGASVRLASGRVHGLLGENGAGKSTLMNIAYGMLAPDGGEIRMKGTHLSLRSPRDAIAQGIGMVHQHFMLAGALSVADNVLLGDRRVGRILNRRRAADELSALADRLGWPLDPLARVERLSVGQQQRVEILKALWRAARVLILDDPPAVLPPPEVDQLFGAVEGMRNEGRSVVFISHKLAEVKRICDDLTALRRGRVVWQGRANAVSATELATLMIGREVETVSNIRGTSALKSPGTAVEN